MLCETHKVMVFKGAKRLLVLAGVALVATGTAAVRLPAPQHARLAAPAVEHPARHHAKPTPKPAPHPQLASRRVSARTARATVSLYEHTTRQSNLRRQGCSAAKRGVGGIVILDFGQPAYNGHTYGTYLFSGRFAGNRSITRAMFAYAYGYHRCLARGSRLQVALARGTSNYHPQVPSAYRAGRKWARETMALQHALRLHGLHEHVLSAAARPGEPAVDPG